VFPPSSTISLTETDLRLPLTLISVILILLRTHQYTHTKEHHPETYPGRYRDTPQNNTCKHTDVDTHTYLGMLLGDPAEPHKCT
jgi:hypothetical protein